MPSHCPLATHTFGEIPRGQLRGFNANGAFIFAGVQQASPKIRRFRAHVPVQEALQQGDTIRLDLSYVLVHVRPCMAASQSKYRRRSGGRGAAHVRLPNLVWRPPIKSPQSKCAKAALELESLKRHSQQGAWAHLFRA